MAYKKFLETKKFAASALKEIGSYLGAGALYPLGVFEKTPEALKHPRSAPNSHPILLVHGIVHNRSAFHAVQRKLSELAWVNVYSHNYNTFSGGIFQMVEHLQAKVEMILERTHAQQIDIIAHSLGGIVARTYMTMGAGRGKVRHLVTLGTPHQGTNLSFIARGLNIGTLAQDLKCGSYLLELLRHTALPKGSSVTSIYSPFDWTLSPGENGAAHGLPERAFQNVRLEGVGHARLLFSQECFDAVVQSLVTADKGLRKRSSADPRAPERKTHG